MLPHEPIISPDAAASIKEAFGWGPLNCDGGLRAKFRCEYCGKDLLASVDAYHSWQMDHVIPMTSGGGNDLDNVALSCGTCNHLKHAYVPSGASREERLADAARYIQVLRDRKRGELDRLRQILGLPESGKLAG